MRNWREIRDELKSEYVEDVITDVLAERVHISSQGNDQYYINGDHKIAFC